MKYADRRLSPAAVIIGGDEFAAGTVTLKDLDLGRDAGRRASPTTPPGAPSAPARSPCRAPSWSPPSARIVDAARAVRLEPPVPAEALAAIRAPFVAFGERTALVDAPCCSR